MTEKSGTVVLSVNPGAVKDEAGLPNQGSSSPATVTYNIVAPTVAVTASNTATNSTPTFTVTFSESVTGFTSSGVTLSGTAVGSGTTASVSGSGRPTP